jgi:uncharacterized protein YodC (DUF2158 family)
MKPEDIVKTIPKEEQEEYLIRYMNMCQELQDKLQDNLNLNKIKIGSVVRLQSGGPWMTVQGFSSHTSMKDSVLCKWFNRSQSDILFDSWFDVNSLELKEDDN